jgi:hypothetical protein
MVKTHADPKKPLIGMWMMGSNVRLSNQTLKTSCKLNRFFIAKEQIHV